MEGKPGHSSPVLAPPPAHGNGLTVEELQLAVIHAPMLWLDRREPFRPIAVGITVAVAETESPSTRSMLTPPAGGVSIEYAIWWDWDIEHMYELECVWVDVDVNGHRVTRSASQHGRRIELDDPSSRDTYCAPGKHAMAATGSEVTRWRVELDTACWQNAGVAGVLDQEPLGRYFGPVEELDHRLARHRLGSQRFVPSYQFDVLVDVARDLPLASWTSVAEWIPRRMRSLLDGAQRHQRRIRAVLLDSGDTLVDEATEERNGEGVVLRASLIPGAAELLGKLDDSGYVVALVADGYVASFENVLGSRGLLDCFAAKSISENVGVEKPHSRMFHAALEQLGISADGDLSDIVMVGNNLGRDIRGANELGITSIWMSWSTRRRHHVNHPLEAPDFEAVEPIGVFEILARLDDKLAQSSDDPPER